MSTTAELPNYGIAELNADNKSVQLKDRTKAFANRVVRLFEALPKKTTALVLGKQALRSGTSVAANYRAACRSRSKAEFIARIGVVAEEADETVLWIELMIENRILPQQQLEPLLKEARELTAIFTASQNTARAGGNRTPGSRQQAGDRFCKFRSSALRQFGNSYA